MKIDTGANAPAIPKQDGGAKLAVLGSVTERLMYKEKSITEKMYMVKDLHMGLLSRPASVRLKLVARVDTIDQETVRMTPPELCDGLDN